MPAADLGGDPAQGVAAGELLADRGRRCRSLGAVAGLRHGRAAPRPCGRRAILRVVGLGWRDGAAHHRGRRARSRQPVRSGSPLSGDSPSVPSPAGRAAGAVRVRRRSGRARSGEELRDRRRAASSATGPSSAAVADPGEDADRRARRRPRGPSRGRPACRRRPPSGRGSIRSACADREDHRRVGLHARRRRRRRPAPRPASRTPRAAQRRLGRGAVVGRRDGDPPTARRAARRTARGRSASGTAMATGSGTNQARLDRAPRGRDARAPAPDDGGDDLVGSRPSSRPRAARRRGRGPSSGSKPIVANTSPATGRRVAPSRRCPSSSAQPPHIAWKSMSVPSLSKTTRSMPVEQRAAAPAPASSRLARRRRSSGAGPAPRTRQASGGNETVTASPTAGGGQVRVVERVERDRSRRPSPMPDAGSGRSSRGS